MPPAGDTHGRKTGIGREAGGALVHASQEGAWPHLCDMDVSDHGELFLEEEVGGVVEVIEAGEAPHLIDLSSRAALV